MRRLFVSIAIAGAALVSPAAGAHVSLLGKSVTAEHHYIDGAVSFDTNAGVVDGDSDAMRLSLGRLPRGPVGYMVDIDGASIAVRTVYPGTASFVAGALNGLVLRSDAFDVPLMLRSFRIVATPKFHFDSSRISRFDEHSIFFDFQGLAIRNGHGFTATFDATAVPEPASWALAITGFGLAGAVLRRRPMRARTAARARSAPPPPARAARTA